MIKSFKDKRTEQIFKGIAVKKMDMTLQAKAQAKLFILEAAQALTDLYQPPSNRFEALGGDLKNHYSIRVNVQWRIVFAWDAGAVEVTLIDYH